MKQLLNYIPVILGIIIVSGAILMTGGFAPGNSWGEQGDLYADTQPATTPVTTSSAPSQVPVLNTTGKALLGSRKSFTTMSSTTDASTTTPTSSSSSTTTTTPTTTTTTTNKPVQEVGRAVPYSSVRIFVDKQRMVLYSIDPNTQQEYPARVFVCSTGKASTPSPIYNQPVRLGGKTLLSRFSSPKYVGTCLVRYVTHVRGSCFIHAVPYLDPDPRGEKVLLKDKCDLGGYRALGRRASSGCIRLCLRDAKFLYYNVPSGTPCYILASSNGYSIPGAVSLPSAGSGSRGWDPTDPERPGYVAETPPPTEVPPPTEPAPPPTQPTEAPTEKPTSNVTVPPTLEPTMEPSEAPTDKPSDPVTGPSQEPTTEAATDPVTSP